MKFKHELFWLIGLVLLAVGLFYLVDRLHETDPIMLDFTGLPTASDEHQFINDALGDPGSLIETKDELVSNEAVLNPVYDAPQPVLGAPLPAAWDSKPAPNFEEAELSPAIQRSLASSASLRTEAFIDSRSEMNLQRVESLRELRKQRQQQ